MNTNMLWFIVAILNVITACFNVRNGANWLLITVNCITALLALLLAMR